MSRKRVQGPQSNRLDQQLKHTQYGDVPLSDGDLFRLLKEQNAYAITCLFDRYSRLVYSTAQGLLRDSAAAEDVMQELFLSLWHRPPSIVPASEGLSGRFVFLARNRAISLLRKRKRVSPIEHFRIASSRDLSREAETAVLFDRVRDLMTGLPREQQKVLELAFFEGFTHPQIASATGHALGTVKTRIRTALKTLNKRSSTKEGTRTRRRSAVPFSAREADGDGLCVNRPMHKAP